MSPYAEALAHARFQAIQQLVSAMEATEDPAETRRCALAIFSAPDPCDLDDEIELKDEEGDDDDQAEDPDQSEDDADSKEDEDEEDSENHPSTPTPAPPPAPIPTSGIAHPTSHIPPPCTCDRCRLRHHLENAPQPQSLPASSPTHASLPRGELTTSPPLLAPAHFSPASMLIATAGRAP